MIKSIPLLVLLTASFRPQDRTQLPAETVRLIEEARTLPPEFSADVLLRIAESRIVDDRAGKRVLLEDAFKAGGRASLPYRKTGEGNTDARASREYWDNGLEALTLQTRTVEASF